MINIDQIISRCSAVDTGRTLLQEPSGAALTPPEFADRVQRLAGGFLDLAGDHKAVVGLLALNSVAYAETMCAAICAGHVCVPLNLRWSLSELNYAVEDAGIEILVVDQVCYATALELAGSNQLIKHVCVTDSDCIDSPGKPLASLIGEPITLTLGRDPDTQCLISYTGGTTGFPKGVVHTHASLTSSAINMAIAGIPSKGSRYLIGVPLFHVSGFAFLFARLLQLDPMVILPRFSPDLIAQTVRVLEIDEVGLVPTMLQMLISDAAFNIADYASLKRIFYGASPISQALLIDVSAKFPEVELTQVYGMTEVGVIMSLEPQFHSGSMARPTACGQPLALARVRIEKESGEECAEGEIGELVHYGPSLMAQYHNKQVETQEVMRNGGLRSGDAGFRDAMGVITLCDRIKDMIISGGENVYSAEVESVIAAHPSVAMVAIIGVPDKRFGEAVHAVIVPNPGPKPTLEAIRSHCQANLAGYKCPRSIELVEALPFSAMNKILKNVLREKYLARTQGDDI